MKSLSQICPLCNHKWNRHDPEDGMHVYVLSLDKTFVFNKRRAREI